MHILYYRSPRIFLYGVGWGVSLFCFLRNAHVTFSTLFRHFGLWEANVEHLLESRSKAFCKIRGCVAYPASCHEKLASYSKKTYHLRQTNGAFCLSFSSESIAKILITEQKRNRHCQDSYLGRTVFGKQVRGERHFSSVS